MTLKKIGNFIINVLSVPIRILITFLVPFKAKATPGLTYVDDVIVGIEMVWTEEWL